MPPACRFTREQIVAAALAITRERGFDAVTAPRDCRYSAFVLQGDFQRLFGHGRPAGRHN